jgi:prevent-host-death family protein
MVEYMKHKFSADDFVPLSELQKAAGKYVQKAREKKMSLLITERGRPTAVLIDFETYEQMQIKTEGDKKEDRKRELLRELEEMLSVIINKYKPERIILFGSLATDTVTENSDIDLIIIKKTNKRPLERQQKLLTLVRPKVATDFFIYTPTEFEEGKREKKEFFADEIEKKGKVLYAKAV